MTDQWINLRDSELAEIAQRGLQGQGAPVEAMRRLRVAIENADTAALLTPDRIRTGDHWRDRPTLCALRGCLRPSYSGRDIIPLADDAPVGALR